jgi:hypothetical protein
MPAGPHRFRQPELARAVKALSQAARLPPENIIVHVFRDGSFTVSAKPEVAPPAQPAEEWKLPDEPNAEVRP